MNMLEGGFVIAAVMAIAYGAWLVWQEPSNLRTIVKTISIGSLSLLSYQAWRANVVDHRVGV